MRFAELDAVTVDGYGTLVRLVDPVPALAGALAERGVERDAETSCARRSRPRSPTTGRRRCAGRDPRAWPRCGCECTRVFLEAAGADLEPESFVDAFMGVDRVRADAGRARDARPRSARGGSTLAVVSNWDIGLAEHLERLGRRLALLGDRRPRAEAGAAEAGPGRLPARARAARGRRRARAARRRRARGRGGRRGRRDALRAGAARDRVRGLVVNAPLRPAAGSTALGRSSSRRSRCSATRAGRPAGSRRRTPPTSTRPPSAGSSSTRSSSAIVLAIARPDWALLALRRPRAGRGRSVAVVIVVRRRLRDQRDRLGLQRPGPRAGPHARQAGTRAAPSRSSSTSSSSSRSRPVVEELTFRGLGYSLLEPLGRSPPILWVGLAFGLAHGLARGAADPDRLRRRRSPGPRADRQRLPGDGRARGSSTRSR